MSSELARTIPESFVAVHTEPIKPDPDRVSTKLPTPATQLAPAVNPFVSVAFPLASVTTPPASAVTLPVSVSLKKPKTKLELKLEAKKLELQKESAEREAKAANEVSACMLVHMYLSTVAFGFFLNFYDFLLRRRD